MKTKLLLLLLLANFSIYAQVNLVSNGGFENWTNSTTLPGWAIQNTILQNTVDYRGGLNSAKLSFASNTLIPKITAQVSMSAGVTYTIRFKYKHLSSNFNTSHPIALNISKNGSAATLSSSFFATDNNWVVVESSFTPDQNLSYDLSISLFTFDSIGFNVAIDDVQVYIKGTEQYTLIPDADFEKRLINLGVDWGVTDGRVLTADVASLKSLNTSAGGYIPGLSITDLTGIQDFTELTSLDCSGQALTNLSLTKNVALTTLSCNNNQLISLDISQNKALTSIICHNNKLTNLDLSQNKELTSIQCYNNALTNLNLPKSNTLQSLQCTRNSLTNLDISANPSLSYLNCSYNKLLKLDISKNPALTDLYCNNNALTDLNLKNGKNTAFYSKGAYKIDFTYNPSLKCISVDNVIYSNKNWTKVKDEKANYTLFCDGQYTAIPDLNFEKKLIALSIDTGNPDGKVLTASISSQTTLDISASAIKDLTGLQDFVKLTSLDCSKNQLSTLNVAKLTDLTTLRCSNNTELGFLDVSNNINLTVLDCKSTKLRTLNLTKNLKLSELNCSYNIMNSLDVSKHIELTSLDCSYNRLSELNVSNHKILITLNCSNNYLTSLDISSTMSLNNFDCGNNKLVNLNAKNGNNLNMAKPNFVGNPNLTCITVDKVSYADTNWKNKDKTTFYNISCGTNIAYTLIPDPAFEQKLIDIGIDTDGKNGKVMTTSVTSVTSLDVSSSNVRSLNGIQDFLSLTYLDCGSSQLAGIDVSKNIFLTTLYASNNTLTALDLSKNIDLSYLDCSKNRLKSLDVSKNTALTYLDLSTNSDYSDFATLDVSNNIALTTLNCSNNKLTFLDVTKSPALTTLYCSNNLIGPLDLSKNTALTKLNCQFNKLWYLDLKNGNNTNLDVANSNFKDNPILECIQVDDAAFANAKWFDKKDVLATFNQTCNTPYTLIPDINFENKLIAIKIDTGAPDGKIATTRISRLTDLDVSSSSISDLTGIEGFAALTYLNCSGNQLTTINLSQNSALMELYLNNNKLTTINTSKNLALEEFYIYYNELNSVDLSQNINLKGFFCGSNKLTVLDVSGNKNLEKLRCHSNQLTALDISSNKSLYEISCSSNNLYSLNLKNGRNDFLNLFQTHLNFKENPNLKCIQVDDEKYSNEKWADKKDATAVYSSNCSSLGLEETIFDKVTISPNPTKGELNINHVTLEKATVYNALGQLVKTFTLDPSNTNNTINLSGLPRGIYYVYLINQDAASAKKIILE